MAFPLLPAEGSHAATDLRSETLRCKPLTLRMTANVEKQLAETYERVAATISDPGLAERLRREAAAAELAYCCAIKYAERIEGTLSRPAKSRGSVPTRRSRQGVGEQDDGAGKRSGRQGAARS